MMKPEWRLQTMSEKLEFPDAKTEERIWYDYEKEVFDKLPLMVNALKPRKIPKILMKRIGRKWVPVDGEGIRNLKEALQEAGTNFEKLYDFRENDLKIILDEMERGCYKSQNELFRAVIDSFDGKMNWKRLQWSGSLLNVSSQEKLQQAKKDLAKANELLKGK